MSFVDIIILGTAAGIILFSVIRFFIKRKKGKRCTGSCTNCPYCK